MRRPSQEREAYWREVMARQAESGLSGAQFCRRENLSAVNFYLWKRKLRERDAGGPQEPAEPASATRRTHFVPVAIEAQDADALRAAIRIRWPSGILVEIPLAAGTDTVERLLCALAPTQSTVGAGRG